MKTWQALARGVGAALGATVAWSLIEPHRVAVRAFDVALPDLPEEAAGLRILHVSDLHVSAMTSARFLARAIETCNDLKPDIVVLTGDYVSRRSSYLGPSGARVWARPIMDYAHEMAREVSHLQARIGVFAVPGNHDHARDSGAAISNLLEENGVQVLLNRNERLQECGDLAICGVDDLRAGNPDYERAFAGVSRDEAQIILAHNPRAMEMMRGRNALLLSGHTHGGQIHFPLTNFRRRPSDMHGSPWFSGWYRQNRTQMYVSSGLGSVHFPARLRCPPEIVVFTLRRA